MTKTTQQIVQILNAAGYHAFMWNAQDSFVVVSNEEGEKLNPAPYEEYTSEWRELCAKNNLEFEMYDAGTVHVYGGVQ